MKTSASQFKTVFKLGGLAILAVGGTFAVAQYGLGGDGDKSNCLPAPTSKAVLTVRKEDAHKLSADGDRESHLRSNSVPMPKSWREYVKNDAAAVALGKALFWDIQVSSDNKVSCATCHHSAGVDSRTKNTTFAFLAKDQQKGKEWAEADAKNDLTASKNFGYITGDSTEVIGSQGVVERAFDGFDSAGEEKSKPVANQPEGLALGIRGVPPRFSTPATERLKDALFSNLTDVQVPGGRPLPVRRQVTPRNSPTVINAVFSDRLFHDGRASSVFNGVDFRGDDSPTGKDTALLRVVDGRLLDVSVRIEGAAAASQALAPTISTVEMSYKGRQFADVGHKLLKRAPLKLQKVAPTDSVLGKFAAATGGLNTTYEKMVQEAFHPEWWQSPAAENVVLDPAWTRDDATMMEKNFSLYFGLAIMAYEATLISDDSPWDQFVRGNVTALDGDKALPKDTKRKQRESVIRGETAFRLVGCAECHAVPEFAGAGAVGLEFEGGPAAAEDAAEEAAKENEDYAAYYRTGGAPPLLTRPLNPKGTPPVEAMAFFRQPPLGYPSWSLVWRPYDAGFYNIGVTGVRLKKPDGNGLQEWDLGIGDEEELQAEPGSGMLMIPTQKLNISRVAQIEAFSNKVVERNGKRIIVKATEADKNEYLLSAAKKHHARRAAVDGAFKTPTLRNISLTAPYMHNGAFASLRQVVKFYELGPRSFKINGRDAAAEFIHPELRIVQAALRGKDVDPAAEPDIAAVNTILPALKSLRPTMDEIEEDIVAFMESLTDARVVRRAAPFDHPSLVLPDGNPLVEVGSAGAPPQDSVWTSIRAKLDN